MLSFSRVNHGYLTIKLTATSVAWLASHLVMDRRPVGSIPGRSAYCHVIILVKSLTAM